jgi:hypothetical protein
MTTQAKTALWVGIVIIVAMSLFPPWVVFQTSSSRGVVYSGYTVVYSKGYAPLFMPPESYNSFVDLSRLVVQWVIVAAITLGLVVTLNQKPEAPGEPTPTPDTGPAV